MASLQNQPDALAGTMGSTKRRDFVSERVHALVPVVEGAGNVLLESVCVHGCLSGKRKLTGAIAVIDARLKFQ